MGQTQDVRCPSCDYRADVSGGDAAGMMQATSTIVCEDCRRLFDAVTVKCLPAYFLGEEAEIPIRCPRKKAHRVKLWTFPGSCPRCGAAMEIDPGSITMWD